MLVCKWEEQDHASKAFILYISQNKNSPGIAVLERGTAFQNFPFDFSNSKAKGIMLKQPKCSGLASRAAQFNHCAGLVKKPSQGGNCK